MPIVAYLLALLVALVANSAGSKQDVRLLDAAVGTDSYQTTPLIALVRNDGQWQQVWAAHKGANAQMGGVGLVVPDAPAVDFKKAMVLAVFTGETQVQATYAFAGAKDDGKKVIVRVAPQPMPNGGVTLQVRPYAFFFLTATKKPVEVQMPFTDPSTGSQQWKPVASFGAAKASEPAKSGQSG